MKKHMLFLAVGLSVLMIVSGCRKYPDGPNFSFISKENRVANSWIVEELYRNDIDETDEYATYTMVFTAGGRLTWTIEPFGSGNEVEINADWELASVKEQIKLTIDDLAPDNLLYLDIRRLTQDELWLHFLRDGDYFLLRMRSN